MPNDPTPPLLVSRAEAARLLGVCDRTIDKLAKTGVLKAIRIGHAVRFRPADIELAIERLARGEK